MALVWACEAVVCEKEEEVIEVECGWLAGLWHVFLVVFFPRLLAFIYFEACGGFREIVGDVQLHRGAPADGG
tara:strand:+ start:4456 stop:4671 length:216 start_codon:yes stop_codon:yes gene_type:complete